MIGIAHAATGNQTFSTLTNFLPIILIVIFFWLIVMRPQQKKIKLHRQMINELKKGDKVITNCGIIGQITKVDNNLFTIEIAPEINVKFEKNSILSIYNNDDNNTAHINKI